MKKLLIFLLVLISPFLIFILIRLVECRPDKSVYEVSRPLAEAVVKHVQKHGRPSDLTKVENLPYKLVPCSEKPKEFVCRDYFFKHNGKYFTAYLTGPPLKVKESRTWMHLEVEYDHTVNWYSILHQNEVVNINKHPPHIGRKAVGICKNLRF